MKRKLIAACVAVVLLVCTLGVSAMAINYDFSFTLTPNGSSDLDAPGRRGTMSRAVMSRRPAAAWCRTI